MMKLVELNWNPTNRQLRQFAIICLFALPLAGWLWGGSRQAIGFLAITGFILAIAGVILPQSGNACLPRLDDCGNTNRNGGWRVGNATDLFRGVFAN